MSLFDAFLPTDSVKMHQNPNPHQVSQAQAQAQAQQHPSSSEPRRTSYAQTLDPASLDAALSWLDVKEAARNHQAQTCDNPDPNPPVSGSQTDTALPAAPSEQAQHVVGNDAFGGGTASPDSETQGRIARVDEAYSLLRRARALLTSAGMVAGTLDDYIGLDVFGSWSRQATPSACESASVSGSSEQNEKILTVNANTPSNTTEAPYFEQRLRANDRAVATAAHELGFTHHGWNDAQHDTAANTYGNPFGNPLPSSTSNAQSANASLQNGFAPPNGGLSPPAMLPAHTYELASIPPPTKSPPSHIEMSQPRALAPDNPGFCLGPPLPEQALSRRRVHSDTIVPTTSSSHAHMHTDYHRFQHPFEAEDEPTPVESRWFETFRRAAGLPSLGKSGGNDDGNGAQVVVPCHAAPLRRESALDGMHHAHRRSNGVDARGGAVGLEPGTTVVNTKDIFPSAPQTGQTSGGSSQSAGIFGEHEDPLDSCDFQQLSAGLDTHLLGPSSTEDRSFTLTSASDARARSASSGATNSSPLTSPDALHSPPRRTSASHRKVSASSVSTRHTTASTSCSSSELTPSRWSGKRKSDEEDGRDGHRHAAGDGNGGERHGPSHRRVRYRRRRDEINRIYACPYPSCEKAYGTLNRECSMRCHPVHTEGK